MDPTAARGDPVSPFFGDYVPRLLTAADLASFPRELPSGPVRYELHHGRLITMTPPAGEHSTVGAKFIGEFLYQGEYRGHGTAYSEVGVVMGRNPDHVFGADAAFGCRKQGPIPRSPEGYLEQVPALIVEVRSKNETLASLKRKAEEYLQGGAAVVWVADPISRNVIEYRKDAEPRTYGENETLAVEDVIPGFSLPVGKALG